jgi:hypothetical protein
MEQVLKALHRAGSEWRDKFDGAEWWSGGAGCYPMGEEHVVEKGGGRILRGGDEGSSGDHVGWERICSDYVEGSGGCSSTTRFREVMVDQNCLIMYK